DLHHLSPHRPASQRAGTERRRDPDFRAGDRLFHGTAHPGRARRHHAGQRHRGSVHRRLQLAPWRCALLHPAGHRPDHSRRLLSLPAPAPAGGGMSALLKGYLALVLGFLYVPIIVMIVMAFNQSPLYALPVVWDTIWFQNLASNERLINAGVT